MFRPYRVMAPAMQRVATTATSTTSMGALLAAQRHASVTDKILIGSTAAFITSSTTMGLFHLIVTPVSASIAAATIATATASGALCVIDGGGEGSTSFGAVVGVFIGAMGGYYAKSQKEPWRK